MRRLYLIFVTVFVLVILGCRSSDQVRVSPRTLDVVRATRVTDWYFRPGKYVHNDDYLEIQPSALVHSYATYIILQGVTIEERDTIPIKVLYLVTNGVERFYLVVYYCLNERPSVTWVRFSNVLLTDDVEIPDEVSNIVEELPINVDCYFQM